MNNKENKKTRKIIVISIISIIILAIIFFIVALSKIELHTTEEQETEDNLNLLEPIPIEEAVNNGWFVIENAQNKIYNKDVLDKFVENTKINATNRVPDKIRIVVYNIDNAPTIYDLEYKIFDETYIDEEQKEVNKTGYILTTDTTRTTYVNEDEYSASLKKITTNEDIPGKIYGITLTEQPEFNVVIISLTLYAEIQYESSEKTPYENIEIARFPIDVEIVQ